jgi:2,3-dihydroxy-p-cumate/2,3-dihydroxybenzoate 3,4-dioxygenase
MAVDFRYRKVGYAALNVTNLERTTEFLRDIYAISPEGEGPNGERFFRCGMQHHDLVLYQNERAGFVRHAWEMESDEDVQKAFRYFENIGLKPWWLSQEESEVLGLGYQPVFRVREPVNGICFEYYSAITMRAVPPALQITEFEGYLHSGINVPDVKATTKFAVDHMGFIVSDYFGDYVGTFTRAFPIPHHHTFAFLPSKTGKIGFNHIAFKVKTFDDIGKYFNRVKNSDAEIAFGMGRHSTSGSIHLYIFDPDGMSWEYSQGMEQFPEENPRPGRFMSLAPEDFDLWGAVPSPGFGSSGDVVTE